MTALVKEIRKKMKDKHNIYFTVSLTGYEIITYEKLMWGTQKLPGGIFLLELFG